MIAAHPLVESILAGDRRAVARAISAVENGLAESGAILKSIFPHTGRGLTIGITGAPGSGKSSLVDRLASLYREKSRTVGIVAVDPSSPFSGGALLGDRIRMQRLANDPGIFIRSMATRGNLGGLARSTIDAVAVLDAAGYDRILIETVGVGQDEVDIVKAANVSVVVLVPGMGDDIQAIKAGIMEIGDVFVINKADRDGVERTERELLSLLEMSTRPDGWHPRIVRTVATENRGIEELIAAVEAYAGFQGEEGARQKRYSNIAENRLLELLREKLTRKVLDEVLPAGRLTELAAAVSAKDRDPYSIVDEIVDQMHFSKPATDESATRIDHLGIAVTSVEGALEFWRDGLGLQLEEVEIVDDQGVKTAMLPLGESRIELLEATGGETPVGKFLSKRGPGFHHVCVEVNDLEGMLAKLVGRGTRLIDNQPRRGAGGKRIAFIHPASTGGVLVELVERAPDTTD